jgi:hypothetical protein
MGDMASWATDATIATLCDLGPLGAIARGCSDAASVTTAGPQAEGQNDAGGILVGSRAEHAVLGALNEDRR